MQTDQPYSTNKIVFLLVFICAAIMASLFIYHLNHRAKVTQLSTSNGFVFPMSRELSPFSLVAANGQPFTQQDLVGHWTLLFFGFTHCNSVCPLTLSMLSQAYPDLLKDFPNLQVAFISLDPARDTTTLLAHYTARFNANFIGVSGKIQDLRKLQSQLGIFSSAENATNSNNYQLQHTSSILLINPQGKWAGMFKYGMLPQQFITAFKDEVALTRPALTG